jgi:hypothetical protein
MDDISKVNKWLATDITTNLPITPPQNFAPKDQKDNTQTTQTKQRIAPSILSTDFSQHSDAPSVKEFLHTESMILKNKERNDILSEQEYAKLQAIEN